MKPFVDRGILAVKPDRDARATPYKNIEIAYQLIFLNQCLTIASMKIEDEYFKPYVQN